MTERSSTKTISANRGNETIQGIEKRVHTISGRFRKFFLKIIAFLLIVGLSFSAGFVLCKSRLDGFRPFTLAYDVQPIPEERSKLRCSGCEQLDNFHQFAHTYNVYLYDTEQKLEAYYKEMEESILERTGLTLEHPIVKTRIARVRGGTPLVRVGPFAVYVNNDNNESGNFWVNEIRSLDPLVLISLTPLLEWKSDEQSKRLVFRSPIERDWDEPRFMGVLHYSKEGVYEWGSVYVHNQNRTFARAYYDSERIGVLDQMSFFEDGMQTTYLLNGLTWERIDVRPMPEPQRAYDAMVLEEGAILRDVGLEKRIVSNENNDVDTEQNDNESNTNNP